MLTFLIISKATSALISSLFSQRLFSPWRTSPYLIRRLLNNCQWSVLCQPSIIMRTYSSIIFAIINTVTTVVATKCILLSAHQKNDRWWCTKRPAPFVKRMRYLIYIYAIPINDYVLLKRRMVFIYLPCSIWVYNDDMRYLTHYSQICCGRRTTLHGAIRGEKPRYDMQQSTMGTLIEWYHIFGLDWPYRDGMEILYW